MKLIKNIFTSAMIVVFMTTTCFGAQKCDNASYRAAYPERCRTSNGDTTMLALAGGAALVGVGIALFSQTNGDHGSSSSVTNPRQTNVIENQRISVYSYTESLTNGKDIDDATIQSIRKSKQYIQNSKQLDAINFAWANARGYTGKDISINVIDDFQSNHGNTVHDLVTYIAPDAKVNTYNIATETKAFANYDFIANTIKQSESAHIYNASWQIPATQNQNAATVIYHDVNTPKNYTAAQEYIYGITDANFINQIRNTAIENDAIFVWAAGNESLNESGALSALPIAFPDLNGHFVNVVALNNSGTIAWYSNQCGITQNYCIAAPGSGLKTDSNDYASGTSFAAPIVSGTIATIKEAFPYMTAEQITALLFTTATDLGDVGVDAVYGWGLLNMEAATKPVGTPKIILSNDNIQPLSVSTIGGSGANALQNANIKIAFVDDFGRAFTTKLSDHIKIIPYGRGFDKLRENENDSIKLFGGMEIGFKQNNLLESSGLISMKSDNLTNFMGYTHEFDVNEFQFYQNIRFGTSDLTPEENSMVSGFSNIYTASAKIGAKWKDFNLEIAVPDTIIHGDMYMNVPITRANNGQIVYKDAHIDLSNTNPSIEYTLGYKNLSATFVNNPDYENEFFIMAKTKTLF